MAVDLTTLSPKDLQALIAAAQEQLTDKTAAHRQATRDRIIAAAEEAGYDVGELFGFGTKIMGKRPAGVVKYRHRTDGTKTWGGRGKRPQWVHDWLAGGGTLEALLIA